MPPRFSLVVAAIVASALLAPPAVAAPATLPPTQTAVTSSSSRCKPKATWLQVGGRCRWTTTLRFGVDADVTAATLRLHPQQRLKTTVTVTADGQRVGKLGKDGTLDVTDALQGPDVTLTLSAGRSSEVRLTRRGSRAPALLVTVDPATDPGDPAGSGDPGDPGDLPADPGDPGDNPFDGLVFDAGTVWVTPAELTGRSTSGPAWTRLKARADASLGAADIADQNSNHDVGTLAVALVYARTGDGAYRAKARQAILDAIGTEAGGRTLALGRNLASYVIAADLIDLGSLDPAGDARFRTWLAAVRHEDLGGLTLVSTQELRPNNWGAMSGASRIAADLYLGDQADLDRAATVFRGYLGDRAAYAGFRYGETSWQADPSAPVGVNPPGATIAGVDVDGALPDDMRRGCSFQPVPCHTGYPWEAMQGVVTQAELLARHGYDAFHWSHDAVLRSARYLQRLDAQFGGWWAASDDTWQPWLINHAYGTSLPTSTLASPGKVLGYADWLYG
jgi:hypothetical protein